MKKWHEWILFFILAFTACAVTLYKFNIEPRGLAVDEVEFAKAVEYLSRVPYQPFTPLADGHPTVYFYILLLSFKIFGITSFALRLPSALFGIGSVFVAYFIFRKTFSKSYLVYIPLVFWITFIFATLRWRFLFTRYSFEMPYLLFLELMGIWCVLKAGELKFAPTIYFVLIGLFSGLAYNSYQPGRIFFLVPLVYLLINKVTWKKIALYLGIFVLTILPMTVYLFQHPADDIRIGQQSYLMDKRVSLDKKVTNFTSNIVSTILMFSVKGDLNGRHNYPGKAALNPILSVLFIGGLILALLRIKDRNVMLFLVYFVVALVPTLLTSPGENPHMLRTYTVIPSVVFFIGLCIDIVIRSKFASRFTWFAFVIIVCCLLSAVYDIRTYFYYEPSVNNHAFPMNGPLTGILKSEKSLQ
ncbi:MAG: glycosyltransferase family 39 protein [Patescibacteria group bacterium]|jgi:4-amino-4-deoxy-L-arabinose transferase-like glycosyltransferase